MTDPEIINKHLENLEQQVRLLRSLEQRSFEEFATDELAVAAAEHSIQLAAQNLLDIGAHILADFGEASWDEYRDIPAELSKHNIVSEPFAEQAARLAGMRNILVHLYDEVDVRKVYEVIQNHLDTFDQFARFIKTYLERSQE